MGKLHLPGPSGQATACGRQLNNHRTAQAQNASNAELATDLQQYLDGLDKNQSCRFCGRAAGLLPKLTRSQSQPQHEDGADSDE